MLNGYNVIDIRFAVVQVRQYENTFYGERTLSIVKNTLNSERRHSIVREHIL